MTKTNYNMTIKGYLLHDNKLFDSTCPNCGGMYTYEQGTCPSCNATLAPIKTTKGQAMLVSEGTIQPVMGVNIERKYKESIKNRKNGMETVYRFKMFSFANEDNTISPPIEHTFCKKGSLIEITATNHLPINSWFKTKKGEMKVETLYYVYPQYGDKVVMLSEKQVADSLVSAPTKLNVPTTTKTTAPVKIIEAQTPDNNNNNEVMKALQTLMAEVTNMKQEMATMKQAK